MFKSIVIICLFSVLCFGQQQTTPQEQVTALVNRQAQLSSDVITALNLIPSLMKQKQDLQEQVKDLQAKLEKKEAKK